MVKKYNKRYLLILFLCILSGMFLFFLSININTPFMGEDFALVSFSSHYEPSSIGEHISLIMQRIIRQASTWNIRIGEQIAIIFCSTNKLYYYIGNAIISVLYVLLIPIYAFGRKMKMTEKNDVISVIISFCLIILFQPALGEIFFWRTGSGNYLWAVFILLTFTIPLRVIFDNRNLLENKKVLILLHTILGFFAGLTNENTVITFIIIYVCTIIYRIIKKQKVYLWIWSSFISLGIGFLVMIFAPSTAIRIQTYKKIFGIEHVTVKDYIYRTINIIHRFFTENIMLVSILLVIIIVYIILNYKKINEAKQKEQLCKYKSASINLIFLLSSALSAGALIGAPYVETRAFFLIDFFMIGCIIYFSIQIINEINKFISAITYLLLGILIILTVKENITIFKTYDAYNKFINTNYSVIQEAKKSNQSSVKISPYNNINNRILNTREDYIQSNLQHLERYFEIKVFFSIEDLYTIDESQLNAKYIEIMNGMDYVEYNQTEKQLKVIGWAAIENMQSENNDISILLKSDSKTYKFITNKYKRKDVSEYYNNSKYEDTGFLLDISDAKKIIENGTYVIGVCIKDNENNSNYIMYTKNKIEVN
ncbi:DUF6056 family protein [Clostridium weizhouense]|uniref:Uncharacterized protein n=1 Tax=Clostridium weizhouense TaxID=2859781 RepID=A0ABS7ANL6_9CLOT|nr:DUF6056 family protein [Clostridium weizhouense]MBW6410267.1 hypothetical protein [Clostridium weizhouense]